MERRQKEYAARKSQGAMHVVVAGDLESNEDVEAALMYDLNTLDLRAIEKVINGLPFTVTQNLSSNLTLTRTLTLVPKLLYSEPCAAQGVASGAIGALSNAQLDLYSLLRRGQVRRRSTPQP